MQTVDLTHPLETDVPVYPGTEPIDVEPSAIRERDGYRTTRLDLDSHAGTHVDAPAHLTDGPSLDAFSPERFRFEAATVSVPSAEPNAPIGLDRIRDALTASPEGIDAVLVATGWDRHWGSKRYLEHPHLDPAVGDWLADHDCDLGIDAINPDPTPTGPEPVESGFPVHEALFERERLIVENLTGLAALPDRVELHAYPLRFEDADASPVRAVGVVEP